MTIRQLLWRALGVPELAGRLNDLERHFVTSRGVQGNIVQTLADVPYEKRKELKNKTAGVNWPQRRAMLEAAEAKLDGTIALRVKE